MECVVDWFEQFPGLRSMPATPSNSCMNAADVVSGAWFGFRHTLGGVIFAGCGEIGGRRARTRTTWIPTTTLRAILAPRTVGGWLSVVHQQASKFSVKLGNSTGTQLAHIPSLSTSRAGQIRYVHVGTLRSVCSYQASCCSGVVSAASVSRGVCFRPGRTCPR